MKNKTIKLAAGITLIIVIALSMPLIVQNQMNLSKDISIASHIQN